MLVRSMAMMIALAAMSTTALAGPNANTTLVLHAVQTTYGSCEIEDPCVPAPGHPTIQVADPGAAHAIYVLIRNYSAALGVQFAMDVPASWVFMYGLWDCIGSIGCTAPGPPWGPTVGTVSVVFFDTITGGATAVVGRAHFALLGVGCMEIIESAFPFGTHVVDPQWEAEPIAQPNRGRVCVGPGGINTCEPVASPVEPTTWGRIKGQYEGRGDGDRANYPDRGYQD